MRYPEKLSRLDKKYIWHPFTQMHDWMRENPLIIGSGKGSLLRDISGKNYIDGISSLWVNLHGHRVSPIDAAVKKQLGRIAHSTFLGLTHEPGILLAQKLSKLLPGALTRVFYSDNGSTAVEVALKMAYQYWQQAGKGNRKKTRFLSLSDAYHGDTLGSVAVGGMELFHKKFHPLIFDVFRAPAPYCYRCLFKKTPDRCGLACLDVMERIMKRSHERIAACIIEPMIQGAAGMIAFPQGYTKGVERLCRKYRVLLIVDEVATGFGKTGRLFAIEHERIRPDIICLAKGITGGYLPLAATVATKRIFNAFNGSYASQKTFFHGHSYTANPLACAAALASIDLLLKQRVLERIAHTINILKVGLKDIAHMPSVGDVRQCGLMAGIEIVRNTMTRESFPRQRKIGIRICQQARTKGVLLRPLGDVIVINPPLNISDIHLKKIMQVVGASIASVVQ